MSEVDLGLEIVGIALLYWNKQQQTNFVELPDLKATKLSWSKQS